jgi:hypothetical protein
MKPFHRFPAIPTKSTSNCNIICQSTKSFQYLMYQFQEDFKMQISKQTNFIHKNSSIILHFMTVRENAQQNLFILREAKIDEVEQIEGINCACEEVYCNNLE